MEVKEVKSNIIKSAPVKWRELKILQNQGLKWLSDEAFDKLKKSIRDKNFVCTFYVWQDGDDIYVLDGVHRIMALRALEEDGHVIPDEFHADFIGCKDRRDAIKHILLFSSQYARVNADGLVEFLKQEGVDFDDSVFDIPGFDIDALQRKLSIDSETLQETCEELPLPDRRAMCCPKCGSKNILRGS